jgi:hypothetical protein
MESQVASRSLAGRWPALAVAAAIVAGGCWLRFAYVGGPYTQPDEPIAPYVVSRVLSSHDLDTNWAHTPLGSDFGVAQYNFSSYYLTLSLLERIRGAAGAHPVDQGIGNRIVFYRACSAGFGTLGLALAMLLAYRIQGWGLALAAGLWIAVNPLLVQDSHYARPEAFLTLMALGLVWLCGPRRFAPGWRPLVAGLVFGFLVACKVTLLFWFWLPLAACFQDAGDWARCSWGARLGRASLAAAGALAGFAAGAPRAVADMGGYLAGLRYLRNEYGHSIISSSHYPSAPVYDFLGRYLAETVGWGIALFFAVGLAHSIAARRWRLLLTVYLPALSLAAFLGARLVFFERNFSHAMPLYLLGAGVGLGALGDLGLIGRWRRPLFFVLAAAAALVPAELTGRMVFRGFSGLFERQREPQLARFLAALQLPAADMSHLVVAASDDDPWFQRRWGESTEPYVVVWADVNPDFTRQCLQRLQVRFKLEERAVLPGLFDDLRGPNTLRDYLCRTLRGFVFHGLRGAAQRTQLPAIAPIPDRPGPHSP